MASTALISSENSTGPLHEVTTLLSSSFGRSSVAPQPYATIGLSPLACPLPSEQRVAVRSRADGGPSVRICSSFLVLLRFRCGDQTLLLSNAPAKSIRRAHPTPTHTCKAKIASYSPNAVPSADTEASQCWTTRFDPCWSWWGSPSNS